MLRAMWFRSAVSPEATRHPLLERSWQSADTLTAFTIFAATALVSCLFLTPIQVWGDDFAGYILQAMSLLEGTMAEEIARNGELMRASDWRTGPDGYPWGYPALVALMSLVSGWDISALRAINIPLAASIGVLFFALARSMGFSRGVSVMATVLVVGQPAWLFELNEMSSDVPFLVLCMASLLVGWRVITQQAAGTGSLLLLGLLAVAVSTLRSNGHVSMIALAIALVIGGRNLLQPQVDRQGARHAALFVLVCAAGVQAYFMLLPDGSLFHLNYLSLEWQSIADRLSDHVRNIGRFAPLVVLPAPLEPVAGTIVLLLCMHGALIDRRGVLLGAWAAGHLGLLTLFAVDAGARYYYPVVPALILLCCISILEIWRLGAGIRRPFEGLFRHVPAAVVVVMVCLIGYQAWVLERNDRYGPRSAEMNEAVGWIRSCRDCRRIGFEKPRALRLLTGIDAVLINRTASLDAVDAVLLRKAPEAKRQLEPGQIVQSGRFRLVAENQGFRFYAAASRQ